MKKPLSIVLITTLVLSIGSLLFYWYQVRPSQIKHECSWVKMHDEAKPGRPAMTKEQLIAKGIIRSCQKEIDVLKMVDPKANYALGDMSVHARSADGWLSSLFSDPLWKATSCIEDGNRVIASYKNPVTLSSSAVAFIRTIALWYPIQISLWAPVMKANQNWSTMRWVGCSVFIHHD